MPKELRLAYRDELEAGKGKENTSRTATPTQTTTTVNRTASGSARGPSTTPQAQSLSTATSTAVSSRPAMSTTTHVNGGRPDAARAPVAGLQPVRQATTPSPDADGVPAWVDKSIFAVIVCLLFMLLKKVFV